jgi:hypothetical protein
VCGDDEVKQRESCQKKNFTEGNKDNEILNFVAFVIFC